MTTLDERKAAAKLHIDVLAELSRQRFISPGAGQVATYQEKAEQAVDFVAAGYPEADIANYPFIHAEVQALGGNGRQAADGILVARSLWIMAGAAVERIRLGAKKAVMDCTTEEEVQLAVHGAIAALRALPL